MEKVCPCCGQPSDRGRLKNRERDIAPDLDKINLIKELLSVKFHKGQISLFCESEVDFMIWFLCTS